MKKSLVYQITFLILLINCLFGCSQKGGNTVHFISFLDHENIVQDRAFHYGITYFLESFQSDDYTLHYRNENPHKFNDTYLKHGNYGAVIGHPSGYLHKPRDYYNTPLITSFSKLKIDNFSYPNHYNMLPSFKEEGKGIAETLPSNYENILVFRSEDAYFADVYYSFKDNMTDINYQTIVISDDTEDFIELYPLFNVTFYDACLFLVSPHHYESLIYAFSYHENKVPVISPLYNKNHGRIPVNYKEDLFQLYYPSYKLEGLLKPPNLSENITKKVWFTNLEKEEQDFIVDNWYQFEEGVNSMIFLNNAITKDENVVTKKWEITNNLKLLYQNIYYNASLCAD